MTEMKNAVMTLVFCAVCGLVLGFLLPERGVSRSVKTLISIIILSAVCTPVFGVMEHFDKDLAEKTIFSSFGERDTSVPYDVFLEKTKQAVEDFCETVVVRYTNVPHNISADAHISEDNVIRIEHVRIVFQAVPEGRDAIRDEIAEECGIIPEIRVEQKNE